MGAGHAGATRALRSLIRFDRPCICSRGTSYYSILLCLPCMVRLRVARRQPPPQVALADLSRPPEYYQLASTDPPSSPGAFLA
eukprot:6349670-Pyramimonas_sp.AAC.1